jgi:hypothetical protein
MTRRIANERLNSRLAECVDPTTTCRARSMQGHAQSQLELDAANASMVAAG